MIITHGQEWATRITVKPTICRGWNFFLNHVANVTWTDLEIIILSEVSQTEKSKCHRIFENRIEMDLFIKQKQTHRVREWSRSVASDSLQPQGLQPTRLLLPWDSPGKSTGVGGHFLLQGIFPTQRSNPCLLHCTGRRFTVWATREDKEINLWLPKWEKW